MNNPAVETALSDAQLRNATAMQHSLDASLVDLGKLRDAQLDRLEQLADLAEHAVEAGQVQRIEQLDDAVQAGVAMVDLTTSLLELAAFVSTQQTAAVQSSEAAVAVLNSISDAENASLAQLGQASQASQHHLAESLREELDNHGHESLALLEKQAVAALHHLAELSETRLAGLDDASAAGHSLLSSTLEQLLHQLQAEGTQSQQSLAGSEAAWASDLESHANQALDALTASLKRAEQDLEAHHHSLASDLDATAAAAEAGIRQMGEQYVEHTTARLAEYLAAAEARAHQSQRELVEVEHRGAMELHQRTEEGSAQLAATSSAAHAEIESLRQSGVQSVTAAVVAARGNLSQQASQALQNAVELHRTHFDALVATFEQRGDLYSQNLAAAGADIAHAEDEAHEAAHQTFLNAQEQVQHAIDEARQALESSSVEAARDVALASQAGIKEIVDLVRETLEDVKQAAHDAQDKANEIEQQAKPQLGKHAVEMTGHVQQSIADTKEDLDEVFQHALGEVEKLALQKLEEIGKATDATEEAMDKAMGQSIALLVDELADHRKRVVAAFDRADGELDGAYSEALDVLEQAAGTHQSRPHFDPGLSSPHVPSGAESEAKAVHVEPISPYRDLAIDAYELVFLPGRPEDPERPDVDALLVAAIIELSAALFTKDPIALAGTLGSALGKGGQAIAYLMGAETVGDYWGIAGTSVAEFAQWLRKPIWQLAERAADQIDPSLYQAVQIANAVSSVHTISTKQAEELSELAKLALTGDEAFKASEAVRAVADAFMGQH